MRVCAWWVDVVGAVSFVNKQGRAGVTEELDYQDQSGHFNENNKKKKGGQIGADYILSGTMATNIQEVGNDKFIYYKLTMNLTNITTTKIDCVEEKEVRKKYKRRTIGL
jgi:PBP1b-binding outer membrane lipoprotein LpoB